jgi:hypothetical protein
MDELDEELLDELLLELLEELEDELEELLLDDELDGVGDTQAQTLSSMPEYTNVAATSMNGEPEAMPPIDHALSAFARRLSM